MSDVSNASSDDAYWADVDNGPDLTPEELAQAAAAEKRLAPLRDWVREHGHLPDEPSPEDLAAMAAVEPVPFEEIPLKLREAILGPQRGSFVLVTLDAGVSPSAPEVTLRGRVERYEPEENTLEVDFYGWYGEFQITHCVAEAVLESTGKLITSHDATAPTWRPGA